jgi:hypothetical protein
MTEYDCGVDEVIKMTSVDFHSWPIATLHQEFVSAMPPKADKPEPT